MNHCNARTGRVVPDIDGSSADYFAAVLRLLSLAYHSRLGFGGRHLGQGLVDGDGCYCYYAEQ
jgi:hypothetical protein